MSPEAGSTWVHDDCERGSIYPLDRKRAEGVLKIHAPCEPPCPRKQTATEYLSGTMFPFESEEPNPIPAERTSLR